MAAREAAISLWNSICEVCEIMYQFRNDYSFGAYPKVLEALAATNLEGNIGYGGDPYCDRAADRIRQLCGCPQAEVQFLIGGTQVNFTAIAALLRPWEGVICPATAHINGHEAGAVEATGHKLIPLPAGRDGKLTPAAVAAAVKEYDNPHLVRPGLVYISQATENGAVYTLAELEALSALCRENSLFLFVDGARLGAALTACGCDMSLADLARLTDAFTIGGTKNGALMGGALVIPDPALGRDFFRIKKQRGGVLAKGWLLGVQFEALLSGTLYFDLAAHANRMAGLLQQGLADLGLELYVPSATNQIFVSVEDSLLPALEKLAAWEVWCKEDQTHTVVRFVTCFQTSEEDVTGFLQELARLL